jgi:hypothetical protein
MTSNEKLQYLAPDLTKGFPRSPRHMLAGYVIAARSLDKCRATLAGTNGEYHFDCPLDNVFFSFTGITGDAFKDFVATGATDAEVAAWIEEHAQKRPRIEIIRWNNEWRGKRMSELPDGLQEFMEDYIPKFIPFNRPIHTFFDIYDIEEQRI